jgi:hypothetical protein
MSRVFEAFECDCSCHVEGHTNHMIPCCETCPHCGKRISYGWLKTHIQDKHPEAAAQKAAQ